MAALLVIALTRLQVLSKSMYIYLPIAEVSMHIAVVIGLGGGIGFLSGLFGVGGGFLMTPMLIFLGVPPAVAVSTEANQIVASSVSGVLAHWRRGNVDFKMGAVLLIGGLVGSSLGVLLFSILRDIGQIDLVIKLSYVIFLGIIGALMLKTHMEQQKGVFGVLELCLYQTIPGASFQSFIIKLKTNFTSIIV